MRSTKPYPDRPSCAKISYPKGCGLDTRSENQRFNGRELFRPGLPNSEEIAEKSGVPLAWVITAVILLFSAWAIIRSWPFELARLWAISWAMMAGCALE